MGHVTHVVVTTSSSVRSAVFLLQAQTAYGNSPAGSFMCRIACKIWKTKGNFEALISGFIVNTWSK